MRSSCTPLPFPCVSTAAAFVAKTLTLLVCSIVAFVAKTPPLPCVFHCCLRGYDTAFVLRFHSCCCLRGYDTAFALRVPLLPSWLRHRRCLACPSAFVATTPPLPSRLLLRYGLYSCRGTCQCGKRSGPLVNHCLSLPSHCLSLVFLAVLPSSPCRSTAVSCCSTLLSLLLFSLPFLAVSLPFPCVPSANHCLCLVFSKPFSA